MYSQRVRLGTVALGCTGDYSFVCNYDSLYIAVGGLRLFKFSEAFVLNPWVFYGSWRGCSSNGQDSFTTMFNL